MSLSAQAAPDAPAHAATAAAASAGTGAWLAAAAGQGQGGTAAAATPSATAAAAAAAATAAATATADRAAPRAAAGSGASSVSHSSAGSASGGPEVKYFFDASAVRSAGAGDGGSPASQGAGRAEASARPSTARLGAARSGSPGSLLSAGGWSSDEVEPVADPAVCDRGVSVELLAELVHEHELGGLTTREVVESFVLPQTYEYGCSLAGLMKRSFPARVGAATHYVVHSWDCNFARLVEMLARVDAAFAAQEASASAPSDAPRGRARARPRPRALFWLDIAAVDQHRHVAGYGDEERVWLHRDELLQTVRTCIEAIPVTVVFMEPAARPLLLRRTWCLYEVMQALSYSRELILSTCPSPLLDVGKPMAAAVADVASAVKAFKPDIEASEASSEADKAWLLRAVSAAHPSGAAWLNEQVGLVLLHWLAQEVLSEMQQADAPPAPVAALRALAALLELLGNIDLAHKQFVNALQAARDQLGTHHTLTLALTHDLACLQAKHLQMFGEAEELLRAALAGRQELLGAEHDDTLETALALARLLQADSRAEEAEALFRRALSGSLLRNGPAHRLTLVAANLLALLLQAKGALPEAHVLLSRTLATGLKTLGSKHLDVLVWRNNMAVLLQDARDLRRAEALFRKTLTDSEQALGTAHPQTLNVVFNLGQCLWQQGKLRPAEMLFRRELAGCQAIYGYKQRETLRSIRNLIEFLAAEGRAREAEEYEDLLEQIIGEDESEEDEDEDDAADALGAALGGAVLGGGAGGSGGAAGALGLSRSGDDDSSGSGSDGIGELRDESVDESGAPTQRT